MTAWALTLPVAAARTYPWAPSTTPFLEALARLNDRRA